MNKIKPFPTPQIRLRELRATVGHLLETPDSLSKNQIQTPTKDLTIGTRGLCELLGNGRTLWVCELLRINPDLNVFWMESSWRLNPTALHQRGISLERIQFVDCTREHERVLRLAIESQMYPLIVAPNLFTDCKTFHRFLLLCQKSHCSLLFMAQKTFRFFWPISLQLQITLTSDSSWDVQIHKQKGLGRDERNKSRLSVV